MTHLLHFHMANRRFSVLPLIALLLLIWSSTGWSRTFSAGYKEYSRGNFSQAEVQFSAALRRGGSAKARANIYK